MHFIYRSPPIPLHHNRIKQYQLTLSRNLLLGSLAALMSNIATTYAQTIQSNASSQDRQIAVSEVKLPGGKETTAVQTPINISTPLNRLQRYLLIINLKILPLEDELLHVQQVHPFGLSFLVALILNNQILYYTISLVIYLDLIWKEI